MEITNQVAVIPDETFCLENNLTPAPKAVWSEIPLPKGWKASNNVLTGRSLPSSDLAALLAAVQGLPKPGEVSLDASYTSDKGPPVPAPVGSSEQLESGPTPAKGLDVSLSPPASNDETTPRLEGGLSPGQGMDESLLHKDVGSPAGLERGASPAGRLVSSTSTTSTEVGVSEQLEGGQRSAGGMDGQDILDSWKPMHDTTGNVLRFVSEMRKQSERLSKMERREEHMETMLEVQSQMINNLQETVQHFSTQLASHLVTSSTVPHTPPRHEATALPEARASQPTVGDPPGGARARVPHRLPRAPQPATVLQELPGSHPGLPSRRQEESSSTNNRQRPTLRCNSCGHLATNERRMSNHIRNMHTALQPTSTPLTLLVGDSHLNSLNLRQVEEALGQKARLITPGAARPREDRAYCSSPDWPGARYPQNSLQQMVPELLGERRYKNLIILAPSNDISNLKEVQGKQERERLAIQSARNTVQVAEQALKSVDQVLIMEQPVRVDEMADLSELSKNKLRELVKSCPLAGKIKIGFSRPDILTSSEKKKEVFGRPNDRGVDGIHMRGTGGKKFLSETVIEAVKFNGLADKDS